MNAGGDSEVRDAELRPFLFSLGEPQYLSSIQTSTKNYGPEKKSKGPQNYYYLIIS